ncbi:uncharacterized protein BDW43DRAFT_101358 [Aspergillus alliaceus]|uniref:uncharacterized protein n=1 Tax=Petromyces alliaceus TaxID=209559 RepID=UPI0012A73C2F|nr:uncharacterized protein BDW43DRAFT_101358 [Aspergillus alliaceus]KAB8232686.1 hypothetical protein BDW43DRAFT_101358 [Aspergillus alliaceus]
MAAWSCLLTKRMRTALSKSIMGSFSVASRTVQSPVRKNILQPTIFAPTSKSHGDISMESGNTGGRVAQKAVDEAVRWYKGLFSGVELQDGGEASTGDTSSSRAIDESLPPLPLRKDGAGSSF